MKQPNIIQKIIWWLLRDLPTYFCKHKSITLSTTSDNLVKGYCQYHASCDKCAKDFYIKINE